MFASSPTSILGMHFQLTDLVALSGHPQSAVLNAVSAMVQQGRLIEDIGLVKFRFENEFTRSAILKAVPPAKHAQLAADASEIVEDPLTQAQLILASLSTSEPDIASSPLIGCAKELFSSGLTADAAWVFAKADTVQPISAAADFAEYSAALEKSGADGRSQRRSAFHLYVERGDFEAALRLVTSNELELERLDGDKANLQMLKELGEAPLSERSHRARLNSITRQQGMLGQHDDALASFAEAWERAESPQESFLAWCSAWPSLVRRSPDEWPDMACGIDDLPEASEQARFHQIDAIRCNILGRRADGARSVALCVEASTSEVSPIQRWYAHALRSSQSFVDGDWEQASDYANQAHELGVRAGIRNAPAVRAAQFFQELWLSQQFETIIAIRDSAPPDILESSLSQAALAAACSMVPEHHERSSSIVKRAVHSANESKHPLEPSVCALASYAADTAHPATMAMIEAALQPLAGVNLVVGAGFADLGPVTHYLSNIEPDPHRKRSLLGDAISEADEANALIWRVALRVCWPNGKWITSGRRPQYRCGHRDRRSNVQLARDLVWIVRGCVRFLVFVTHRSPPLHYGA